MNLLSRHFIRNAIKRKASLLLRQCCCWGTVVLSACTTVGPDFKPLDATVQDAWAFGGLQYESLGEPTQERSEDSFWAGFQDETLLVLLKKAETQSLTLRTSAQQIEQAQAYLRMAQGGLLPTAQLAGSSTYSRPDLASKLKGKNDGATTDQWLGQVSWELDFWGRQRRALEAESAQLESSQMALAAARISLQASVASAYCNVRMMEQRMNVAHANLAQQAENMRIAEARFRLGATSELDWRQAQTQYAQTQAQVPGLRTSMAQYRHALSVLVGETPDYFARHFAMSTSLPMVPVVLPIGAPRDLLRRRPDVRQAELTAAAQSARIGQATAALYPTFSLTGSWGFASTAGLDQLFQWDSRAITYGAGFSFPIFDRGRLKAQVQVQDSVFGQAVLAYQNQVLKAQQEVEDALAAIEGGTAQLDALQRAAQAASRSAQLALTRYRAGQTDYTTVSSAEQARLQTSDALVQAQASVLLATISAYRALGGGWAETNNAIEKQNLP